MKRKWEWENAREKLEWETKWEVIESEVKEIKKKVVLDRIEERKIIENRRDKVKKKVRG